MFFPIHLAPYTFAHSGRSTLLKKLAKAGQSKTNACRNLHQVLRKHGKIPPVRVDATPITIRLRKPKVHTKEVFWPMIRMTDWIQTLMHSNPQSLLGGHSLDDTHGWKMMFSSFWSSCRGEDPDHPFYAHNLPYETSVPYFVYGDEGRGLRSRAFMVLSWQLVISHLGMFETNEKGHLMF